jgi:hypothetical protein
MQRTSRRNNKNKKISKLLSKLLNNSIELFNKNKKRNSIILASIVLAIALFFKYENNINEVVKKYEIEAKIKDKETKKKKDEKNRYKIREEYKTKAYAIIKEIEAKKSKLNNDDKIDLELMKDNANQYYNYAINSYFTDDDFNDDVYFWKLNLEALKKLNNKY